MGDTITCSECGDEAESMEELNKAHKHEVPEFDEDEDGGFNLFENKDLFLCELPHPTRSRLTPFAP